MVWLLFFIEKERVKWKHKPLKSITESCDRIETKILKGSVYLQIASIFEPEGINGTYFVAEP